MITHTRCVLQSLCLSLMWLFCNYYWMIDRRSQDYNIIVWRICDMKNGCDAVSGVDGTAWWINYYIVWFSYVRHIHGNYTDFIRRVLVHTLSWATDLTTNVHILCIHNTMSVALSWKLHSKWLPDCVSERFWFFIVATIEIKNHRSIKKWMSK